MSYDFSTLIAAFDLRAQNLASTANTKDLVYLSKSIEALNQADDKLVGSNNLSDVADAAVALANLGFGAQLANPTDGQGILYDAAIGKWVNATLNTYEIRNGLPPYNSGTYSLGDLSVNSSTGEIFVCVGVDTTVTPTEYKWIGSLGGKVGYNQGEVLFLNENWTGYNSYGYADYTHTFTVPDGVTSICAVCVGGGAGGGYNWANSGGGGGALAWANNIPVAPGDTLTIVVGKGGAQGNNGGNTYISKNGGLLFGAQGGQHNATTMSTIATPYASQVSPGNLTSGRGGLTSQNGYGGGGGAGGYTGNGGNGYYGSTGNSNNTLNNSINGTGGAAGGGNGYASSTYSFGGGGGVGLYGQGQSGRGYPSNNGNSFNNDGRYAGGGGSGGERGADNSNTNAQATGTISNGTHPDNGTMGTFGNYSSATKSFDAMSTDGTQYSIGIRTISSGQGGLFGGGAAGGGTSSGNWNYNHTGGAGGARILWGEGRAFPSTDVKLLPTLNIDGSTA